MQVVTALIVVIGLLLIVLWRMSQSASTVRKPKNGQTDGSGLWRRLPWRRHLGRHPLDTIEDPREAAAAMMVAIAQWDDVLTEREEEAIREEMATHFDLTDKQARALIAHGRWLARDVSDLGSFLKRASPLVRSRCAPAEKRDLIEMLTRVADVHGRPDELIEQEITRLAEHLARV